MSADLDAIRARLAAYADVSPFETVRAKHYREDVAALLADVERLRARLRESMDRTDAMAGEMFVALTREHWAERVANEAMAEGLAAVRAESVASLYWMDRAEDAERELSEARAELAAERARREADASPYAIIAGAAGALHGKSLDECPHPKGSHPEALWGLGWWEVTARRHEKRAERIRAEARARGLVAVLREARALLIDEHDEGEGVSCGACSAVVRIDAALAAAEGGE
jgi:hypothetical protein